MIVPTLAREWALWRAGARRVAGVDEVGMACLAGPVVAAALVVKPYCRKIAGVRDSKTLSLQQRERLYPEILKRAAGVGVGAASVREINELNIYHASHLAMWRALRRVRPYDHALVDGLSIRDIDLGPHTAVVDGDALSYAIASASIVAKVTRDRLMVKLAERYPGYGWEQNVGYATRVHRQGLRERGLTPFHRTGFGSVKLMLLQPTSFDDLILQLDQQEEAEAPVLV
ncbi:MAG: ribonuclease HII [Chloroflexi bacterium]|nr:ribonuclease HII [Chloroflexota bacterium]MBV9602127.1 ribonuclease HII [Chloroflexota bacterium]